MNTIYVKALISSGWVSAGDIFKLTFTVKGNYELCNVVTGAVITFYQLPAPFPYKRVSWFAAWVKKIIG